MVEITEIKENTEAAVAAIPKEKSTLDKIYDYSLTPIPAWIFATSLFSTPFITKQPITTTTTAGSFKFTKTTHIGPSPISSLLFGSAFALGGWIIHDGDVESGSGFISAWSTLYLIANGRKTFDGLRYAKIWPVFLTSFGLINGYIYGKRFFFTNDQTFQE